MIFYTTNKKLLKGFDGYAYGPIAFIHEDKRGDAGLLVHEKVHIKQFWKTLGLHGLLYKFSKKYRLKSEREAYTAQGFTPEQIETALERY